MKGVGKGACDAGLQQVPSTLDMEANVHKAIQFVRGDDLPLLRHETILRQADEKMERHHPDKCHRPHHGREPRFRAVVPRALFLSPFLAALFAHFSVFRPIDG